MTSSWLAGEVEKHREMVTAMPSWCSTRGRLTENFGVKPVIRSIETGSNAQRGNMTARDQEISEAEISEVPVDEAK